LKDRYAANKIQIANTRGLKHGKNFGPLYAGPMALWFSLFFLAPIIIIIVYSFLKKGL